MRNVLNCKKKVYVIVIIGSYISNSSISKFHQLIETAINFIKYKTTNNNRSLHNFLV